MINANIFFDEAMSILNKIKDTQADKIVKSGEMLTEVLLNDGVIHVFGTGHSKAFSMDFVYRAGGLVPTNSITFEDLVLKDKMTTEEYFKTDLERETKVAHKLWDLYDIRKEDAFILVSNSGRNQAIVEFAKLVKENNMPLIVVTSMEHSKNTTSRHSSGKKLYDFGDIVIDNCGALGDTLIKIEELNIEVNSISSIACGFIAQSITSEIVKNYKDKNLIPPIYLSTNIDNGDEHNKKLAKKYEGRI